MSSFNKDSLLLYAVTDRMWTDAASGNDLLYQIEEALKGGISCLQLREKDLDHDAFLKEAFEVKALCKKYNVPFIINDSVDIAVACGADGIHVGQHDMAANCVRDMIPSSMILGVSAQTAEQALLAQKSGADYLGVGAVFTTSTKLDADYVPYDTLKSICTSVHIPVVAIGGISKNNMSKLAGSCIAGVALVSAIFACKNICSECVTLKELAKEVTLR